VNGCSGAAKRKKNAIEIRCVLQGWRDGDAYGAGIRPFRVHHAYA
jgi:hypothetical protein